MKTFKLNRERDATGISGEGIVAEGVQFSDGTCVLRWMTESSSTGIYASLDDVVAIHGHNGNTKVVWETKTLMPIPISFIRFRKKHGRNPRPDELTLEERRVLRDCCIQNRDRARKNVEVMEIFEKLEKDPEGWYRLLAEVP